MKLLTLLFILLSSSLFAQQIKGKIVDANNIGVPGVKFHNTTNDHMARSNVEGMFSLDANIGDSVQLSSLGFDTLYIVVTENDVKRPIKLQLQTKVQELIEVNIVRKRLASFDVGFLPKIKGVQINNGTNAVIELSNLNGAKSMANPREIFAKVPGINIWESDGAGIQIGIGGRGLSPKRTANFNTRQNGYDISADALGYPESYYTPPFEALKSIEIIRGSASLQFGSQFGGLLNFNIKDPVTDTPFEFTTRNTGGTYGYFGTFNRISGTKNRFFYQAYHQYKRGDGYRENSDFNQHQLFAQLGYYITENITIKAEYTHMNYLAHQAGGLSDLLFEKDPQQSLRKRNWFKVNWNVLAMHFDYQINRNSQLNVRVFGISSSRKTLGFLGKITQQDPGGRREMIEGNFNNFGAEARYLHKYSIVKDTSKTSCRGAFLVGARYYRGHTTNSQGLATDGDNSTFDYLNPNDLEGSSYDFPSENIAGFLENIFFIGKKWTINFGVRFEHISSGSNGYYKQYNIHPVNGDTINIYTHQNENSVSRNVPLFGFGTSFKTSKRSSLYTNFTQNYRAINFSDIRINNNSVIIDSIIKDEYGYTAEIGFRGVLKDYFIYDLAGFYIFYGDKIGIAPKPGTILKEKTNIGNAQNYGVELFAEFNFLKAFIDSSKHALSLFVNGSYIESSYINSKEANYVGKQVEYVSKYIARSGIKYGYKGFSCQIQGSYNSEQFTDASNSIVPSGDAVIGLIPQYYVFDFSAKYSFPKHFQLELGINNFLNQQYFTRRAVGYPGPGILPSDGRNFYFTLQYQFRLKTQK